MGGPFRFIIRLRTENWGSRVGVDAKIEGSIPKSHQTLWPTSTPTHSIGTWKPHSPVIARQDLSSDKPQQPISLSDYSR